jgi:hypothetical protein
MHLNPTFNIPCPNPVCTEKLPVTRADLSAGFIRCAGCKAKIEFKGEGAKTVTESLEAIERAFDGFTVISKG